MKKSLTKSVIAAALALPALAFAGATPITFDVNGAAAGGAYSIDVLDWAPGNALAVGGAPFGGTLGVGYQTQLLYQANLSVASLNGTNVVAAGFNSQNFSVVAGVKEKVAATGPGSVQFTMDDVAALSSTNFFYMYANGLTAGNNLTGKGFTAGTMIMSGYITSINSSNYSTLGGLGNLDNFGANNYGGILSLIGSGSTDLTARINFADANYFPDLNLASMVFAFSNTSQVTPFAQVNPSAAFSSDGILDGNLLSNIGPVNGANFTSQQAYNFQFQADGNSSFSVPEPDSLALFGLALGFAGLLGRRRAKKA